MGNNILAGKSSMFLQSQENKIHLRIEFSILLSHLNMQTLLGMDHKLFSEIIFNKTYEAFAADVWPSGQADFVAPFGQKLPAGQSTHNVPRASE